MKIRNKKASIPVVILVLLTIALVMFTLVSFKLAGDKTKARITDFDFVEKTMTEIK